MSDIETMMPVDDMLPETSTTLSNMQTPLLSLPPELREMIFQLCFDGVILYTRSGYISRGHRYKQIEWHNNPCTQLLLVSKQISADSFEAMLHTCVLDIWGATPLGRVLDSLPLVANHIRHVAVAEARSQLPDTASRCDTTNDLLVQELHDSISGLSSLESVFIDGLTATAVTFISTWAIIVRETCNRSDKPRNGIPAPLCVIIKHLFSVEAAAARERPLKLYLRCTTFDEVSH